MRSTNCARNCSEISFSLKLVKIWHLRTTLGRWNRQNAHATAARVPFYLSPTPSLCSWSHKNAQSWHLQSRFKKIEGFGTLWTTHSCQFVHFNTFISIHSFQFLHFNSFVSVLSFHVIHFKSFISSCSCHFIHFISFISIPSFQFFHFHSFISIRSFMSIPSFQLLHFNWFMSIHAFHACHAFQSFHFISIHSNSPWIPMTMSLFRNFRRSACQALAGNKW